VPGPRDIALISLGTTPGLRRADAAFKEAADTAKQNCPVSKALQGIPEVTLDAELA
jgi:osmotically inducible protein OsmC